jgi:hypothetical protein
MSRSARPAETPGAWRASSAAPALRQVRWKTALAGVLTLLPLGALYLAAARQEPPRFPHEKHEGLFPLCAGCHVGIETGSAAELYPAVESCAACHDGVTLARATYAPPRAAPTNLIFEHVVHAGAVARSAEPAVECATCHASAESPRMTVEPLQADRCLACHAPPSTAHLSGAPCATCHVPLAESGLPLERVARIDLPSDHEPEAFLRELHGRLVVDDAERCATCHTRDRCVSCHVDAGLPEIALLPPAPPTMELPPATARYPVPASHERPWFGSEHVAALQVSGRAGCATCHTRDDCASCHLPPLPEAADSLPARARTLAPGVGLFLSAPESHGPPRFALTHGTLAATDRAGCISCHSEPFCAQCHQAPQRPSYHVGDFLASHAAPAWSRNLDCSTCHETQTFCRSCHLQSGLDSQGRLNAGYHDAEPLWLLRHGQPARQALESCASCHSQRNCMQCHSDLGAFRVSPHGPGFDAERALARSPRTCALCHVRSPLGGA